MERLDLDLLRTRRRPGWASYALLCLALLYAGDVAQNALRLTQAIEGKELRLASLGARAHSMKPDPALPVDAEEFKLARETLLRLATPWEGLFQALEETRTEQVALLEVSPDPATGVVMLSGEAKDYLAALSYVATLEQRPAFRKVRLMHHEIREKDPQRPTAFTVSAAWSGAR